MNTVLSGTVKSATLLLIGLSALCSRTVHAEGPVTARSAEIRFMSRVPSEGGQVICSLFRESGWLKTPVAIMKSTIRSRGSTCVFTGVEPGTYAIVAFHDKNGNGNIDKNFLGIPTESWCTSRNAAALFGPPRFSAAKFLARGGVIRLSGWM